MKIIIATGIYPPDIGGPATYSKLLASELKKAGRDIVIITYSDNLEARLPNEDFKVVRILRSQGKLKRYIEYFKAVLKETDSSSTVYAQDPISSGIPACFAAKIKRSKFILKIVGDYAWEHFQRSKTSSRSVSIEEFQDKKFSGLVSLLKSLERRIAKSADTLITPSEYLKKVVLKWGVKEEKIKVILNSYTPQNINCEKKKSGKYVLVSVGRLVPWKGFSELIQIMPELQKENPNFILNIIGEGPEHKTLKSKIKDLKLEGKVFLKGKLPKKELFCELKNSDIFILNTSYEGLSHQLLEVIDAKIPIITTNVGGNPEVIENKKTGILVEEKNNEQLKNEILQLSKDADLKNILIKNAEKSLEKFSKEKMIKDIFNILLK